MNSRRISRSVVIGMPLVGAAAVAAIGAAQTPAAPGDPLIAGFRALTRRRFRTRSKS